jgi:HEAT repeat protein
MLGQLAGIDTILVGDDLPDLTTDAVISRVRQNPAFEGTPTYLLTADEDLADAYGDRIQGSFAGADGIEALSEVFEARLDENRARADALAENAANALRMLGWRGNSDLSGAVPGLAAATEGRRDGIAVPALHTIGLIGDASHVDVALAVLSNGDASDESRIAAAEAVGMIGGRIDLAATVSSAMREVMDSDASLELRTATAKALGHMNLGAESRAGVLESVRSRVGAQ